MVCAMPWIRESGGVKVTMRKLAKSVRLYGAWLFLSILGIVVAFQLRVTLLYMGLFVVKRPSLRPPGWNTSTIHGLDRFVILILGIIWLFMVAFLENYLREGFRNQTIFWQRVGRFGLMLVVIYVLSYLFLLVLPGL